MSQETTKKAYNALVEKVTQEIFQGVLKPGDRLKTERDLAMELGISRNSVREGLRVLENIGVVASAQGSGNYISEGFTQPLTDILSLMYILKGISREKVNAFRHMIEREALLSGMENMSDEDRRNMAELVENLLAAKTEKERVKYDKAIHHMIVINSHNDFLIWNYEALTIMIDRIMEGSRAKIIDAMTTHDSLEDAHRQMAEGIIEKNYEKALEGLERHFDYLEMYDVEESSDFQKS